MSADLTAADIARDEMIAAGYVQKAGAVHAVDPRIVRQALVALRRIERGLPVPGPVVDAVEVLAAIAGRAT